MRRLCNHCRELYAELTALGGTTTGLKETLLRVQAAVAGEGVGSAELQTARQELVATYAKLQSERGLAVRVLLRVFERREAMRTLAAG